MSCLLLVVWLLLSLGAPLPNWRAKDRSRPFPCMDSVCGCYSAEQCWRICCCHTDSEKLVWSAAHGVTPPAYVVAAAKAETQAVEEPSANCHAHAACHEAGHRACSPAKQKESCCRERELAAPSRKSGNSGEQSKIAAHDVVTPVSTAGAAADTKTTTAKPRTSASHLVTLASLQRCLGQKLLLVMQAPSLPAAPPAFSLALDPGAWIELVDLPTDACYCTLDTPPPRRA